MKLPSAFPRLKDFRFPHDIVDYAVQAYHRFALGRELIKLVWTWAGVLGFNWREGQHDSR